MSDEGNIGTLVRERLWFDDGFTQVPNTWLRDKNLTWQARGVLGWILSHEAGFEITIKSIHGAGLNGRDAVRAAVNELERSGYLKRYRRREGGRLKGIVWHLFDPHGPVDKFGSTSLDLEPNKTVSRNNPRSEPKSGKPTLVEPTLVEPTLVSPTTIEDHLEEHLTKTSRDQATDRAREIKFAPIWSDERCPGDWRSGRHSLGTFGSCIHCHEKPIGSAPVEVAS